MITEAQGQSNAASNQARNPLVPARDLIIDGAPNNTESHHAKNKDLLRIYCQNANGFPTNTTAGHKLKAFAVKLKNAHIALLLETGASRSNKVKDLAHNLDLSRENKMPVVKKA